MLGDHFSYKSLNDLDLYKANQLESTFIEVINFEKSNTIIGCLYKHPVMEVANSLLDKRSKENKQFCLLGNFNIHLLLYNDHQQTNEFLVSLASNSFIRYILQPTRLTSHSSNVISHEVISVNITATILPLYDHLLQIVFVHNVLSNPVCQKSNIYERD